MKRRACQAAPYITFAVVGLISRDAIIHHDTGILAFMCLIAAFTFAYLATKLWPVT